MVQFVKTVTLTNIAQSVEIISAQCEFCHLPKKIATRVAPFANSEEPIKKYHRK